MGDSSRDSESGYTSNVTVTGKSHNEPFSSVPHSLSVTGLIFLAISEFLDWCVVDAMGFYTANYRSTNSFIQIAMRDLSITNSFSYVEVVLWILPIVGGIVADRWVGRRAMILIGHAFRIISLFFILIA